MATAYTVGDSLGLYHTGAVIEGGSQYDEASCLGGKRAGTEVGGIGALIVDPVPPVIVEQVSGANGVGDATITAIDADTLAFTEPGGTIGASVAIADGETKVLPGSAANCWARVTRDTDFSGQDLGSIMTLDLRRALNNLIGMGNITNAERVAGKNTYRGAMLRAHGPNECTSLAIWVKPLQAAVTTDAGQLGAAGAGTVVTTGSLASWSTAGYAHIKTLAGATREIVYYTSRTATTLTVPAAGRGLLGTAAGAGAADDTAEEVPGVRVALEAPGGDGAIQAIANETAAPAAVSWDTGTTSATGLTLASLSSGSNYGLWLHRQTPAGATAAADADIRLGFSFDADAVTYTGEWSGQYRIEDTTIAGYELNAGIDTAPDLDAAADATSATLPFTFALVPPGAGERTYNMVVRWRNAYGLIGLNQYTRAITIDAAGNEVTPDPSAPVDVSLQDAAGGEVDVLATYYPDADGANAADYWQIYSRGDGTDPVPGVDTPVEELMAADAWMGLPRRNLRYALSNQGMGSDVHVIVRTKRSSDAATSTNTTASTITVGTEMPQAPTRRGLYLGTHRQQLAAPVINETTYIDQPNNVYLLQTLGATELWDDVTLVWRMRYDGASGPNNGIWTTFGYSQTQISGVPSAEPYEYDSVNQIIYISVNGVRRMKIDVANTRIYYTAMRINPSRVVTTRQPEPIYALAWHTAFLVVDKTTWDYVTVASLDYDGILASKIGWRQRATVGEFL